MLKILPFVAIVIFSFAPHKFYVSKTMVNYNSRTQGFEVTCKYFTDDLEVVLSKLNGSPVDFSKGTDARVEQLLESYLGSNFRISFDDQPVVMRYVGKEVENDLTYCYLEFFRSCQFHTAKVENTCLFNEFPEQQNIVDISAEGVTSTAILTKAKPLEVIFR